MSKRGLRNARLTSSALKAPPDQRKARSGVSFSLSVEVATLLRVDLALMLAGRRAFALLGYATLCFVFNGIGFFPSVIPPLLEETPFFFARCYEVKGSGALNYSFREADTGGMRPERGADLGDQFDGKEDNGGCEQGKMKQPRVALAG